MTARVVRSARVVRGSIIDAVVRAHRAAVNPYISTNPFTPLRSWRTASISPGWYVVAGACSGGQSRPVTVAGRTTDAVCHVLLLLLPCL